MGDLANQTLKGYQLHERIGQGGFGEVYRAFQPVIKREVAIKVILAEYANRPEFIRRFEAEAQLIARLEHPSIVPLYDYWRQPDGAFLVLRWLRGGSLTSALKQITFEPDTAAKLLEQIAGALAVAHRNNVVHRDIKPDNILLDDDRNAYLTDFGISTMVGHTPGEQEGVSGTLRYIAPEQLREEPDAITSDIYSLGIVMFEVLTGSHPFQGNTSAEIIIKHMTEPVPRLSEIRPDLPESLNLVIQKATAKTPADRYQSTLEMALAFRQALTPAAAFLETTEWKVVPAHLVNPFKGLRAFQEADASDFFGRQVLIQRLSDAIGASRFVAVVGPSGSGKSSVVRAGLIPALRNGALPGSKNWFIADMTPGTQPFEALEAALLSITANPELHFRQLFQHEHGLSEAVKLALPAPGSQLVLVIDQFEELFTMVEEEADRQRFLNILLDAVQDATGSLRVVMTLRADFYDRPLLYPGFGELVRASMETVLPLNQAEIQDVILSPIAASGVFVEAGLDAMIVHDVEEQPGALPLLQYALTELFERHDEGMLTIDRYRDIGGVFGALARRAEQIFQTLDMPLQAVTRQLFLRLVTPGDGAGDTRRRVSREELTALDTQQLNQVLDTFGAARLLTFDYDPLTRTPTVEVAHEALIQRWERLHNWIEASREDIQLHRRLINEAEEWRMSGRDAGFLATDARLEQYDSWSKTTNLVLNESEQTYLSAALERREAARKRDEARKAHELELQRNANRRLQYLVTSLAVFLVVALGLSAYALTQRDVAETARVTSDASAATAIAAQGLAERRADEANSLERASRSALELSGYNTDLALYLALAANRIENPPEVSQIALLNAAYAPGTRHQCELDTTRVAAEAFSPDGKMLLTSAWNQLQPESTLTLWDTATCQIIQQSTLPDAVVTAIAFMSDNATAVYATLNTVTQRTGTLDVQDVVNWKTVREQPGLGYSFHLALSPNQKSILVDYMQAGATLWDITTLKQIQTTPHPYYISSFLSDSQRAVSADYETAVLWDTVSGEVIRRFDKPSAPLSVLAVSPDEKYAIGGTNLAVLVMWDMATGHILKEFRGHGEEILDIAFLPDGQHFLSASNDHSIRLWDIDSGIDIYRFDGHTDDVRDVLLLPEAGQFISWSMDNTLRIWDLYNASQIRRYAGHTDGINAIAVSPDGKLVASGDTGSGLILWDTATGQMLHKFEGVQFIQRLTFSADGQYLLTAANNGLFLHNTGNYNLEWQVREPGFSDARYSADGKTIIATLLTDTSGGVRFIAAKDGTVLDKFDNRSAVFSGDFVNDREFVYSARSQACLWDRIDRKEIRCFQGHTAEVASVRLSPDGTMLLTGSYDGTAKLWDVASGDPILTFEGHSAPIFFAGFSQDGSTVLTGSGDASFRVWDVKTGKEIHRMNWTAPIWAAAFVPNAPRVVIGSEDGLVSLWDISVHEVDDLIQWVEANRYVPNIPCAQLQVC